MLTKKNICNDVHSSFIQNSPKLEKSTSKGERINKFVVQLFIGRLLDSEKGQTTRVSDSMEESHKHYTERNNADTKEYTPHDSIHLEVKTAKRTYGASIVEVSY